MSLARPIRTVLVALSLCLTGAPALGQDDPGAALNQLVGQADQATAQGKHETAIEYLTQALALELRPVERFEILLIRANANRRAGHDRDAAADWRAALDTGEATPQQYDAIMGGIADVWMQENDRQKLTAHMAQWRDPGPAAAPAMYWLTRKWLRKGDFDRALDYARPLAELDSPNHAEHLKILVALLVLEERIDELNALISRFDDETAALMDVPDMDAEPIYRVSIAYPRVAAMQGREGHCDMVFGVNRRGEPENITADCSAEIFKKTSIETVKGWRYLPRIEDGKFEPRQGVKTRLTYGMQSDLTRLGQH